MSEVISSGKALAIFFYTIEKGVPLGSGASVGHEEMGAIFMPEIPAIGVADLPPVLVGDNIFEGDVMLAH